MKDHEIAALVSELTKTAVAYAGTQHLRERIANLVVPAVRLAKEDGRMAAIEELMKLLTARTGNTDADARERERMRALLQPHGIRKVGP